MWWNGGLKMHYSISGVFASLVLFESHGLFVNGFHLLMCWVTGVRSDSMWCKAQIRPTWAFVDARLSAAVWFLFTWATVSKCICVWGTNADSRVILRTTFLIKDIFVFLIQFSRVFWRFLQRTEKLGQMSADMKSMLSHWSWTKCEDTRPISSHNMYVIKE